MKILTRSHRRRRACWQLCTSPLHLRRRDLPQDWGEEPQEWGEGLRELEEKLRGWGGGEELRLSSLVMDLAQTPLL